jgi:uncharacterized DUF497 family protein
VPYYEFFWLEEDNVAHLAEHGVTPAEAEYVVTHATPEERDVSRTSGEPVAFGFTPQGRHLCVVYAHVDDLTVYVVTAFDAPPLKRR